MGQSHEGLASLSSGSSVSFCASCKVSFTYAIANKSYVAAEKLVQKINNFFFGETILLVPEVYSECVIGPSILKRVQLIP